MRSNEVDVPYISKRSIDLFEVGLRKHHIRYVGGIKIGEYLRGLFALIDFVNIDGLSRPVEITDFDIFRQERGAHQPSA